MSFGNQKCAITPGQLGIVAKIANGSITTVSQREVATRKFLTALLKVEERKGVILEAAKVKVRLMQKQKVVV